MLKKAKIYQIYAILTLLLTVLSASVSIGGEDAEPQVAILVSLNIKPYMEALQGIGGRLKELGIHPVIYQYEDFSKGRQDRLREKLHDGGFDFFITVGPEAKRFIVSEFKAGTGAVCYTMVLEQAPSEGSMTQTCGISLRIPAASQMLKISRLMPEVRRIGLLFDPERNSVFYRQTLDYAGVLGVEIVPIEITSRKEIPEKLADCWNRLDAVWMIPDRTIISESIIQYIIKESILKNKPVIGYNRFFFESGAAFNFIFDYKALGEQTADLAHRLMNGASCIGNDPNYQLWLNASVIRKLGIVYSDEAKPYLMSD